MRLDLVLHLPPIWGMGGGEGEGLLSSPPLHPSPSRCNRGLACVGAPVGWCIMGIH